LPIGPVQHRAAPWPHTTAAGRAMRAGSLSNGLCRNYWLTSAAAAEVKPWRMFQVAPLSVDRPPYLHGRERHVDVADAVLGERIEHGIDDGGRRAATAGLAGTLDAKRVAGGRRALVVFDDHGGHIVGTRQAIVHERARQRLARAGVVHHLLQ